MGWSFGGPDLSAPHVRQMYPGSSCVATEWSPSVVTWRLEPAQESALRLARGEGRGPRAQGGPRPAVADLPSVFHGATAQGAEDVSLGLARRCTCRPELAGAIGRAGHCIARLPGHQQRRVAEQEAVREHHRVHFCRGVRGAGGVGGGRARRTLRPVPFAKSRYTAETLGEAPGRSGLRGGQTRHSDTCFWSWRDLWGMVTLRGSRAGTGGNVVVFRCSPPDSTPQSLGKQTSVDGGGKVRVVSPIVRRSCATSESPACSFCCGGEACLAGRLGALASAMARRPGVGGTATRASTSLGLPRLALRAGHMRGRRRLRHAEESPRACQGASWPRD